MSDRDDLTNRRDSDAWVRELLAVLRDLSPDEPLATAMPEAVWSRLRRSLGAPELAGSLVGSRRGRHSWQVRASTLVAAAACLVLVGLSVERQPSDSARVVLAAATAASSPLTAKGTSPVAGDAAALAADTPRTSAALTWQPPRRVMASGTVFRVETLGSQVDDLLNALGIVDADTASRQQRDLLVTSEGFTSTLEGMADCLAGLPAAPNSAVLVVDRGTLDGVPAGVVVALRSGDDVPSVVDIWVVQSDCTSADPGILAHAVHDLGPSLN